MRIVVLGGAGAMGQVIVRDLAESEPVTEVVIADVSLERAERVRNLIGSADKIDIALVNLTERAQLVKVLAGAAVVINSTAHRFNLEVMEAALEAHCNYVDLGGLFHMTRKQLQLDQRFRQQNLLAVPGMGAAPGMTNVMAAHAASHLDVVDSIEMTVAGVDLNKSSHPFLPPYALETVLDEYALEPVIFEGGQFVSLPPLSGEAYVDFPAPVGKVAVFLTLHSEIATLPISFTSKSIRAVTYRLGLPTEFHERAKFLVALGFGSGEPITVDQVAINPRRVLAKLIELHAGDDLAPDDCEVIRVDVQGSIAGDRVLVRMESVISSRSDWRIGSGALDTGVPPSIVAQMIGLKVIEHIGVVAPEICVPAEPFFLELSKRLIPMCKMINPNT